MCLLENFDFSDALLLRLLLLVVGVELFERLELLDQRLVLVLQHGDAIFQAFYVFFFLPSTFSSRFSILHEPHFALFIPGASVTSVVVVVVNLRRGRRSRGRTRGEVVVLLLLRVVVVMLGGQSQGVIVVVRVMLELLLLLWKVMRLVSGLNGGRRSQDEVLLLIVGVNAAAIHVEGRRGRRGREVGIVAVRTRIATRKCRVFLL